MSKATKKHKTSKWFRVAVEGATTDGREIERSWINDMAEQYSQDTYGARVNVEHMKGFMPEGPFGAYGDVVALKKEEVEINGVKKLALFAQIDPTAELIELNKKRQKIYTSIEVKPNFADTNKAYLMGLAVTDSPASLGTEALSFSAKHGTLSNRKTSEDTLFTAAEETQIEFEEERAAGFADLKEKVVQLFGRVQKIEADDNQEDLAQIAGQIITAFNQQLDNQEQAGEKVTELSAKVTALTVELEKIKEAFNNLDINPERPPVTGGDDQVLSSF